jgi:hypothetical protein
MSTVSFVLYPRSKSPRITWTCDDCDARTITSGPWGWDGPVDWVQRRTPADLVRDLCATCATVAVARAA